MSTWGTCFFRIALFFYGRLWTHQEAVSISSVDFDLPVDFVNEEKRGIERYCASEDGERQRYQGSVALIWFLLFETDYNRTKIKKSWNKGSDLQFGVKVEDGIQENVEGATRADEEASPPPEIKRIKLSFIQGFIV